jgi:hypothetical protein
MVFFVFKFVMRTFQIVRKYFLNEYNIIHKEQHIMWNSEMVVKILKDSAQCGRIGNYEVPM